MKCSICCIQNTMLQLKIIAIFFKVIRQAQATSHIEQRTLWLPFPLVLQWENVVALTFRLFAWKRERDYFTLLGGEQPEVSFSPYTCISRVLLLPARKEDRRRALAVFHALTLLHSFAYRKYYTSTQCQPSFCWPK